ncbi:unnamed protein product, partial [marine sediment metagenome]
IIRLDVKSGVADGKTIEIQVQSLTASDTVSGTPLDIEGTTTIGAGKTVALIGDGRPALCGESQLTTDLNALLDQMAAGWSLDAVVTLGDMDDITTGTYTFDGAYAASDVSSLPVFFTTGNHDITDDDIADTRAKYAGYPDWNLSPGPTNGTTTTYSFDVGDIHVVVLNVYYNGTSDDGGDGDVVDDLFDWLKTDLRASDKPYKIVTGHEPAYPVTGHVGDSLDGHLTNRNRFWNLLKTERVISYSPGHDHTYHFTEYDGVYEFDGGVTGCQIGTGDSFATLLYAHYDADDFVLRAVNEGAADWGGTPT